MNKLVFFVAFVFVVCSFVIVACTHAPYVLPVSMRTGDSTICFERDILPILNSNCAKGGCHDSRGAGGYTLDSYVDVMKNGIVPGNYEASKIYQSITISGSNHMPKDGASLNATQIGLIKEWIYSGALDGTNCTETCDTGNYAYGGAIKPMFDNYCAGCHSSSSASASGGGYVLDNYDGVKTVALNGMLIGSLKAQGYPLMPSGGTSLSDCQITQVEKWIAAGTQNN